MEFPCQTIPIDKLIIDTSGVARPLCNSCIQTECTNPIRIVTLSIMGVPQKYRVWTRNSIVRYVIGCQGYLNEDSTDVLSMERIDGQKPSNHDGENESDN